MKNPMKEWIEKWRSTPHKEEAKLRNREWRMAAKTPSFNMFELAGKKIEEDPIVQEAREELERLRVRAAERSVTIPPVVLPRSPRVSQPDYATIDRVGELARQFVAQGLTMTQERLEDLGALDREDDVDLVTQSQMREVEEQEWEVMARTTTTRRRRTATTPGRAQVSGPTTKNDPVFVWGMQSSKPRAGGQFITYEVRLNDDGSLSCNCPGWIFKKRTDDRGCKHTRHEEVVSNFKDFFERFKRGEQLPTIDPPQGQASATTAVPRTPTVKDQMKGFGRLVILDD